ncbi:PAS domain S-box protein [Ancylobacter sonchi]|uniref:PAS domain S-box protein n=1 Tax=Ancylobacter sonchi TaxID=1937790 RepID=UPI001BD57A1C|nr:PAS domain S-box protein [Ancylobacter sonchi]MBS7534198.1 PAS domain S-box protein [Ancylobacter sonchi]
MRNDEQAAMSAAPNQAGAANLAGATRDYRISARRKESEIITSFELTPLDGAAPPPHVAGQYLTLFADIPGLGEAKRNYTISTAPNGDHLRVSVKREPHGQVSRWLHDTAQIGTRLAIAPPAGTFVLPATRERPIVMVSGGVGLTPMIAMLEALAAEKADVPVHFVHCARDGAVHAFGGHVKELVAALPNARATIFYSRPRPQDRQVTDFDVAGRVTLDWLKAETPLGTADLYVCGPLDFLRALVPALAGAGVEAGRLHYEFFGPVEDLFDEAGGATAAVPATGGTAMDYQATAAGGFTREEIGDGLLDSAADAVVASDRDGRIVVWNAGAARIFGFSEAEALGQSLDIIIPEPFRARHWEGYAETVASGKSRYGAGDLLAVPGLTRDGRRISLEFTIVLLKDAAGEVRGMASVLRDVTRRFEETRALKKELAALKGG